MYNNSYNSGPSRPGGFKKTSSFRGGTPGTSSPSRFGSKSPSRFGGASKPASKSFTPSRFTGNKNRFGGNRGGFRRGAPKGDRIDVSKFVNKAVITEVVENFVPEHKFQDFLIHEDLKTSITTKGYVLPTPIQDKAIPHVLKGSDVVGIANTGTGKTAAFLIPLIHKVLLDRKQKVLVIVPTRELAIQIEDELRGFTKNMKIFSVCCVGGAPIGKQIFALKNFNSFVIGTPGRLKDLIERKFITLSQFNTVVLDEADRMLDMGFINDMRFVMSGMPKDRHTLFFSATLSSDIERLIGEFLRTPVRISVKTRDTSKNVDQDVVKVGAKDKLTLLHELLTQKEFSKVLIFGRTKHGVEKLSKVLAQKGFKAESIHGNKTHGKRQQALGAFKKSHIQILVATDVAARGLDISDISHVINYDIPATYDDYVHRIGRTGRGNKKGKALTFIE